MDYFSITACSEVFYSILITVCVCVCVFFHMGFYVCILLRTERSEGKRMIGRDSEREKEKESEIEREREIELKPFE